MSNQTTDNDMPCLACPYSAVDTQGAVYDCYAKPKYLGMECEGL